MNWQVSSFVLLGAVLVGGFVWYERSRPSARMIALVAALAALAVAGRLVFAPIPNVQATTDIVLFTGFALGAAPGFAVGALGALVSNLWLGQGPWTPWEMAGWGLVGIAGAGLGALTARRLGRFGLAAAGAVAGLAYGALLDFSVMATAGGNLSLERYLAISARGVPFNVAHAVGNAVLALAAGPALVRMIVRYRERTEFRWRPELVAPLVALAVVAGALGPAQARAGATAAGWLAAARNSDGGFGTVPGSSSSAAMTGWASLGLEAAGRNPLDLGRPGSTPIDFLRAHADTLRSTGDIERTILAFEGAGADPHAVGGHDLVRDLRARRGKDGSYEDEVNLTAFGILALAAAGAPRADLAPSVSWLAKAQGNDGGWGFQPGIASDPDSTGAALQGIVAGGGSGAVAPGVRFLRRDQNGDGGWPLGGSGPSNSQSTAWAIQGLIAAGASPASVVTGGHSGFDYLAARQDSDGHYRYSASSDQTPVWVTGQALLATDQKAFPLAAVARAAPNHRSHQAHRAGSAHGSGGGSRHRSGTTPSSAASSNTSTTQSASPSPSAGHFAHAGHTRHAGHGAGPRPQRSGGRHARAAVARPAGSRQVFADTAAPPAAQSQPTSGPASGGSDSARSLGIGAAAVALAGAGFIWWRRRRA
ncbi:MAG: energy-coupling factor transport system substrate-specific component [Solirubrobacterales bacterium]|nr:energy-coupling factor transport system substrate-specific component [Solirubrobacterales bacterium]